MNTKTVYLILEKNKKALQAINYIFFPSFLYQFKLHMDYLILS